MVPRSYDQSKTYDAGNMKLIDIMIELVDARIPLSSRNPDIINSLVGKACTKTGNKPGVTKGKQWIKLNKNIELLDTPGILWPKFEDQQVGLRLALIGSIRDEILNQDEMAIELIEYLKNHYKGILADRYQVDESEDKVKILEQVAMNRNCKMKGNELDYEKASKILLEEFRNGKLGKISLEVPEEIKEA